MKENKISLLKALQRAGAGSRRNLADFIMRGKVAVNSTKVDSLNFPVDTGKDIVTINGRAINLTARQIAVIMLNKPAGIISSRKDERGRKTVMDLLPDDFKAENLYPAGRLDKDTTGLLLLTNDGDLAYQLTHPKFEHEKEYHFKIRGRLSSEEIKKLEEGMQLEDGRTYPAVIREMRSNEQNSYSIVIHEGRKRQVRRMLETLGQSIISLHRVRVGALKLGNLKTGEVRALSQAEINKLLSR